MEEEGNREKEEGWKRGGMCVWRGMGVNVEQFKSSNQYFYKYLATSHLPV